MYILKITSSENDADNYNTWEYQSEDKNYIQFYIDFAKIFYSSYNEPKGVGNESINDKNKKFIIDEFMKLLQKYGVDVIKYYDIDLDSEGIDETAIDIVYDLQYEIIGIWNEGYYYRVFEKFAVHEVPSKPIDVSDEFN